MWDQSEDMAGRNVWPHDEKNGLACVPLGIISADRLKFPEPIICASELGGTAIILHLLTGVPENGSHPDWS